jgi:uncharacterized Fe-S center protein
MTSQVLFAPAIVRKWDYKHSQIGRLEQIIERLDFGSRFEKDEYVAIKTHLGSWGAHRIVRPVFLRKLADAVKAVGAKPFVCDSVRIEGWDYLEVANQNGINPLSMGCPVIMADGIFGCDSIEVEAGPVLGSVAMATAIYDAPAMLVVTHCKGHIEAGYGGAIKNLAMGGVAGRHRSGEWRQARGHLHAASGESDVIRDEDKCTFCLQCLHICPTGAIEESADGQLIVVDERCWRCGRCERVCPEGAIRLQKRGEDEFQAGLAEAAQAVMGTFEPGKVLFFNFALEIQPECDCMPMADLPIVQDQGIFAGEDVVAVEQATLDTINRAVPLPDSLAEERGVRHGEPVLTETLGVDGQPQIDAAAAIGLGSKDYELARIDGD